MTSYNEFHISKKVRNLCDFDKGLFASSGNIVFANLSNVRAFQLLYNDYIQNTTGDENQKVSAGQLNAMGLIDEILHHICLVYRLQKAPDFMKDLLAELNKEFSQKEIDSLLLDFLNEFPPVEVYQEKCTAQEYLERTAIEPVTNRQRTNREQTLEEMILLHLANENTAFKPFFLLFSDSELAKNKLYSKSWKSIQIFSLSQPSFGPFNHDLINLLKEPQLYAPDSLRGQLEYIQKYWEKIAGKKWFKSIFQGIDTISEEEKAAWHGFGGGELPDMQPYSYENLMNEYERYSPDSAWMPKVILLAKTVLVWLDQLTKQYGYTISRLDQIPDSELDKLRDEGFTGLWLIGLWERSKASRRIKQICGNPEAAASAYSLFDYEIAENIGGWSALENLRTRLWQRGIRLASDMVPNHTGMDGDWVINRPELFIQRRDCPFPHYSFNGENLSQDSRISLFLEDHYYSKNDCSVVFKRVDNQTGDTRYIYHGNDGTGLPWNDTAQIDFLNPQAREAVMQEILHVAQNFPIIRFDAAMVLAKKSIRRLWYPEPGHGGDIATRSETGLSTQEFNDAIPNEFWREVVDRVAKECPDTLLLAEAFWMMEGYFVRTLGMHRVYNSAFMNMLKKEENQKYRETVKNTIIFDPQILKRYVNFMNNPDEETAIAQFGDGDKYFGVCTLMITMPGLPMFGHGQIEGFTEKYGMEYTKAYKDEKPSQYLVDRHWKEIFPLMKKRYLFSDVENFLFYDFVQEGHVNENVFAYSNGCGSERIFVAYNNKFDRAYGWIKDSNQFAVKTGNGDEIKLESHSISEGLCLNGEDDKYCIFQEHKSGLWFIRKSSEICQKGMFIMLNGFEVQVFMNIHQVTDTADHHYQILCDYLNGKGCEDIETAWQELKYADLYKAFEKYTTIVLPELADLFKITIDSSANLSQNTKNKIDTKKIKEILLKADKEMISFSNECNLESQKLNKKKTTKKYNFAKDVEKRLVQLARIHNTKTIKTNTTKTKGNSKQNLQQEMQQPLQTVLQKVTTPIKFAKLLEQNENLLELELICRALCGKYCDSSLAFDVNLSRKFTSICSITEISSLISKKTTIKNTRFSEELAKLFLLSSVAPTKKMTTEEPLTDFASKLANLLVNSKYKAFLSGTNYFDKIWWFNKELCESSINKITMLMLLNSSKDKQQNVFTLYKMMNDAVLKSSYKADLFCKEFEPKKTQKTTVKKTKTASSNSVKSTF